MRIGSSLREDIREVDSSIYGKRNPSKHHGNAICELREYTRVDSSFDTFDT